ncbi:MAG: SH3 domain-containing protein [Bauldia sp.]
MVSLRKSLAAGAVALGAVLAFSAGAEAQYGGLPPPYGVPQPQIAVPTPTPTPGPGQATQVFTTNDLNLRVGAGTSYPAIAVMPRGSAFLAFYCEASQNWCFGDWNGIQGWASARYLTTAYYPPQPPAVVYPVQPPPIIVTPGPRYYGPGVNIWLYAR